MRPAGLICAGCALIAAVLSPAIARSACGADETDAGILLFVAAVLSGMAVALLMPRKRWRFLVVPLTTIVVLVVDGFLFVAASLDTHYCG